MQTQTSKTTVANATNNKQNDDTHSHTNTATMSSGNSNNDNATTVVVVTPSNTQTNVARRRSSRLAVAESAFHTILSIRQQHRLSLGRHGAGLRVDG
jgi:hypothetical protein